LSRELDSNAREFLRSRFLDGNIMLFTGAGFSRSALALDGHPVPGVTELRNILWPVAFPGEVVDEQSSLADVYDCARTQNPKLAVEVMRGCLSVDSTTLPAFYRTWFSASWERIYTLNVDDLVDAAQRVWSLPFPINTISFRDGIAARSDRIDCVHLNGRLQDLPDVTFSAPQYGQRSPGRDPWYASLVADLKSRSFVFVGTTLEESPLWEHMELRGSGTSGRELRPRSFLVSPEIPRARQAMLQRFNIELIQMTAEQFADEVIRSFDSEIMQCTDRRKSDSDVQTGALIQNVAELRRRQPLVDLGRFLLGREPTFRDVTEGFAIERSFEAGILSDAELLEPRTVLITGTAGTGKSTALRRVAIGLEAAGKRVGWLDTTTINVGIPRLRESIALSDFDYIAVDDVDLFGEQAGPFLRDVSKVSGPRIIATARSTRASRFKIEESLTEDSLRVVAPPLTDDDIDLLVDALSRAGLLGQLAGRSLADQREALREKAGRQLLVAMIEATSGRSFNDKIDDECSQLRPEHRIVYAVVSLATRFRISLQLNEILAAIGVADADGVHRVDDLVRQHLLVRGESGGLLARHRVIAEQVVSWFKRERQLAEPVEGLLFAMGLEYMRTRNISSRPFRLLVRLLNHQFMIEEVTDRASVRQIYETIGSVLSDDFHFWLQRGSFELEVGDLDLAENYLNQAKGLAPEDYRVRAAWSYMSLRRAADLARTGGPGWRRRADEAIEDLFEIIATRGSSDSHAVHIVGSQGLHYLRRAPLARDEKAQLLDRLRRTVSQGCKWHQGRDDLRQLRDDLEHEYLLLATKESGGMVDADFGGNASLDE
jgi:hypothetical protein